MGEGQGSGLAPGCVGSAGGHGKSLGLDSKSSGKPGGCDRVKTLNSGSGHCRKLGDEQAYFHLHRVEYSHVGLERIT